MKNNKKTNKKNKYNLFIFLESKLVVGSGEQYKSVRMFYATIDYTIKFYGTIEFYWKWLSFQKPDE